MYLAPTVPWDPAQDSVCVGEQGVCSGGKILLPLFHHRYCVGVATAPGTIVFCHSAMCFVTWGKLRNLSVPCFFFIYKMRMVIVVAFMRCPEE